MQLKYVATTNRFKDLEKWRGVKRPFGIEIIGGTHNDVIEIVAEKCILNLYLRARIASLAFSFQCHQTAPKGSSKDGEQILCTEVPVWTDWAIIWTLANFLKPFSTTNLPKSLTFLGKFCKGVKIYHFYRHLAIFYGNTEFYVHRHSTFWCI